jgi:hypothetical protein
MVEQLDYTKDELMIQAYRKKTKELEKQVQDLIDDLCRIRDRLMTAYAATFDN